MSSARMNKKNQHFDIVIVGGGMVGTALACALSKNDALNIAIIENREPELNWDNSSFDQRVSAITRGSQHLFEQLGVWQAMHADRISPYSEMFVWDATGDGHIHFDCADVGEPNLGHIIENRVITRALTQRVEQLDNVHLFCPAKPIQLAQENSIIQLELEDGNILETTLVIGADGANSWVRQQASIETTTRDYNQRAVVTTVKTSLPHQETAWQRFLPTGPLAFLPLTDNYSSIVWSTTPEQAQELLDLDDKEFKSALANAFDHKLGDITELGHRAAFPLKGQHAKHYVKPHLALVGDAAHTIHPLAGQGVNLGFADINTLAEVILEDQKNGKAIGSLKALRRYERSRRGDNLLMLESMGAFKTLFSNENTGLSKLRNLGLSITNKVAPAKQLFMRHAMGLTT